MSESKNSILPTLKQSLLIPAALLLCQAASFSQSPEKPSGLISRQNYSERLYIITDRDVYITGEQVFLKIYCLNRLTHRPSFLSRVAYVSLLDSQKNPVVQVKLPIPQSTGSGQLLLPDTIRTGNYYISACTHWMKNFSPDLFSYKRISVINPFRSADNIKTAAGEPAAGSSPPVRDPDLVTNDTVQSQEEIPFNPGKANSVNLSIRTAKASYSGREKVRIDILATDSAGRPVKSDLVLSLARPFSLSGTDHELIFPDAPNYLIRRTPEDLIPEFLPEPDGHLIEGTIMNTVSGEPLRNENIVLSFVGKTALCRFSKTDNEGRFKFVTSEYGTREVVIQPLSPDIGEYYVELDNPFPDTFGQFSVQPFAIDTARLEEINKAIISMQVRRIFEPFLPVNRNIPASAPVPDFFGKPDNTTLMSTFIKLTSLREAIKEIIPGVVTTKRRGKTTINAVFRFKEKIYFTNPLILVDGVPVYDHEKVLGINLDKIEKVDVLNLGYIMAKIYLDGIIDITTYKGDLSEPVFDKPVFRQEFEALQKDAGFRSPDYSGPEQAGSRIPDFRNTLYWNPDIKTDSQGMAFVEFYTSDEPGDYTVLVEGFTPEGAKGKALFSLTVTGPDILHSPDQ